MTQIVPRSAEKIFSENFVKGIDKPLNEWYTNSRENGGRYPTSRERNYMDMSLKFVAAAIIMGILSLVCFLIPEFVDTDIPLSFLGLVL